MKRILYGISAFALSILLFDACSDDFDYISYCSQLDGRFRLYECKAVDGETIDLNGDNSFTHNLLDEFKTLTTFRQQDYLVVLDADHELRSGHIMAYLPSFVGIENDNEVISLDWCLDLAFGFDMTIGEDCISATPRYEEDKYSSYMVTYKSIAFDVTKVYDEKISLTAEMSIFDLSAQRFKNVTAKFEFLKEGI